MKVKEEDIKKIADGYQECLTNLAVEMMLYGENLIKIMREADVLGTHDFNVFGETAFLWKLNEYAHTLNSIRDGIDDMKDDLGLQPQRRL